jgi:hypothetical protein
MSKKKKGDGIEISKGPVSWVLRVLYKLRILR